MAVRRSRRSSPLWRLAKKAIVIVTVLVSLRLVWLTLIKGWGPREAIVDVQIKDHTLNELQRWKEHGKYNIKDTTILDKDNGDIREFDNSQNVHIESPDREQTDNDLPREAVKYPTTTTPRKLIRVKERTVKDKSNGVNTSSSNNRKYPSKKPFIKTYSKERNNLLSGRGMNSTGRVSAKVSANLSTFKKTYSVKYDDNCEAKITWGQKYHAKVSTYDLVKLANYTMDDDGAYFIPTRKAAEILKDKNLNHVNIILVPFSHADPGYGMTMEGYYTQRTRNTLNNMLVKLMKYPNMTFQWAETVFLSRWFEDLKDEQKEIARKLIRRGQLEIVLGGWVMPDEASTHYVSVVDQLIEGHQWLIENLGVKPRNAWVNDPFGYSSTMPYLWKLSGMDNLLFLRIDQALKAVLMTQKSLDFKWRPYWKRDNTSDVLATLMAYTNYWIADVCGPQPSVCNEFGFINQGYNQLVVEITSDNVEQQSMKLYEQLRITADLYKYNTVYIGLGEDFSFGREEDWDNLYNNYKKIIDFFESRKELKMKIRFGTLSDYFSQLRQEEKRKAVAGNGGEFPTLSGDFFPYTEKKAEYWTGYFSTRPMNKRFSRDIESLVRAADIFNVIAYSLFKHYGAEYRGYYNVTLNLRLARRELGMFLHHDGITGTSLPFVIEDFEMRLMRAYNAVNEAFKAVISTLLSKGKSQTPKTLQDESSKQVPTAVVRNMVLDSSHGTKLVLVNSLPRKRRQLVSVFVNSKNFQIESPNQSPLPMQITTLPETDGHVRVTFPVELPAFGIDVYEFRPLSGNHGQHITEEKETIVMAKTIKDNIFSIRNDYLTVYFDAKTGMIRKVTDKTGRSTAVIANYYAYKAASSGAYIFGPAGPAEVLTLENIKVKVSRGAFISEVKVIATGMFHSVRLYNTSGLQGRCIFVTNEIDMPVLNLKESEVVLRYDTDLKNGNNFFTDQNGYQLMGRETKLSRKIEANYYPLSTMAILEDSTKRFSVHSKQPHGVTSLSEGQLEVMLDRHTFRDDGRGLGQGYYQNVNVNSDFVLQIEYKTSPRKIEEVRYTHPTQDSSLVNDRLQNDIFIYSVTDGSKFSLTKFQPLKTSQLPCDVTIVGMRNLATNDLTYNGTSLVLHRKSFECGYQSITKQSSSKKKITIRSLLPKLKGGIVETTLSHLDNIATLQIDSDIRPERMELRAFRIQV